jgi:F-type H+-transporting ATPase subunit b
MLDIDWTLGVALISVIVFLTVMNKVLFQPLVRFLEARDRGIADDLAEAARLRQQAEGALTTYEAALATARREMAEQAAAVQRAMEAKQRELSEHARQEAAQLVAEAQATLAQETEQARAQLAQQARELAQLVAAKLIGRAVAR